MAAAAALFAVTSVPANAVPAVADVADTIVPHRAAYKLSLGSARNSANVNSVKGAMTFEWADVCDGWTTQQRFDIHFTYAEGNGEDVTTSYATWESKDGTSYRFNVRKAVNGESEQDVRGTARLGQGASDGGAVSYAKPENREEKLVAGTLFPTAHTVALIQKAKAGDKFFSSTVFDGTDEDGATLVSAVIAAPVAVASRLDSPLLKNGKAWPVRMAFFPTASSAAQPDYEMTLNLLASGVAEKMRIDYGDFVIDAQLEKLETLTKPGC
jgi:hypothetical protein